jgi:hypothetical protein
VVFFMQVSQLAGNNLIREFTSNFFYSAVK